MFRTNNKRFSWWWLGVKIGVLSALLFWWWLENQKRKQAPVKSTLREDRSIPLPEEEPPSASAPAAPAKEVLPDDLTRIEGIGPKINATLHAAGVKNFAQLAGMQAETIKQILLVAGIRLGNPATWPEQSALAAAGNWSELTALQSSLKAGRRA